MNLISVEEASKALRLPPTFLPALRRKEQGPAYIRMGAKVFYTQEALDAWVAACTHVPQPLEPKAIPAKETELADA